MTFEEFRKRFDAYADRFRLPDGTLPEAMDLKYHHTLDVLAIAEEAAAGEGFPEPDFFRARLGALFHDTARFVQIRDFHTFDDRRSGYDHGHAGAKILLQEDLLAGLPPEEMLIVLSAVELHNKPAVDLSLFGEAASRCIRMTRDADKLAILDILVRMLSGELQIHDENIVRLGQLESKGFSPAAAEAVLAGRTVYHGDMHNFNDFKLLLCSWSSQLCFPASARLAQKRGYFETIASFLPQEEALTESIRRKIRENLSCLCSK